LLISLLLFYGCNNEIEPSLEELISIEIKELSRSNNSIDFELVINNLSKKKIEISPRGKRIERALVSEIEINDRRIVVKGFSPSFSIDPSKSQKHQFSVNISLIGDVKGLNKIKFYLGVMKWRMGTSSVWRESGEGIYLENNL